MPKSTEFDELPPDRQAVVARLRREIAAGTYDTPERMEAALDAFLDRSEGNGRRGLAKGNRRAGFQRPPGTDLHG